MCTSLISLNLRNAKLYLSREVFYWIRIEIQHFPSAFFFFFFFVQFFVAVVLNYGVAYFISLYHISHAQEEKGADQVLCPQDRILSETMKRIMLYASSCLVCHHIAVI
jgi:hypothetical protein